MRKFIKNTSLLISLIFNLSLRSDYPLLGLLISIIVSSSIIIFHGGESYFNISSSVSALYILLVIIKDYTLQEKHFYALLNIKANEILFSKLILYNILSVPHLFLMSIMLSFNIFSSLFTNMIVSSCISTSICILKYYGSDHS